MLLRTDEHVTAAAASGSTPASAGRPASVASTKQSLVMSGRRGLLHADVI